MKFLTYAYRELWPAGKNDPFPPPLLYENFAVEFKIREIKMLRKMHFELSSKDILGKTKCKCDVLTSLQKNDYFK